MARCEICKRSIGKEPKEPVHVQISNNLVTRYIHRRICKTGNEEGINTRQLERPENYSKYHNEDED